MVCMWFVCGSFDVFPNIETFSLVFFSRWYFSCVFLAFSLAFLIPKCLYEKREKNQKRE